MFLATDKNALQDLISAIIRISSEANMQSQNEAKKFHVFLSVFLG